MPLRPAPFLPSALLLLACSDPSTPAPVDDTGTTTAASSTSSSSSGADPRGDTTTGSVDTTAGSGSATGTASGSTSALDDTSSGGTSSSGPGESSSESTGAPLDNGCADGEREALADEVLFPNIAACAGGFTVPGVVVNVPYCDRQGGDDGPEPAGAGCSIEDLCGEGWHVCVDRLEVMDAGVADCDAEAFGGSFFATRQSGEGNNTCNATGLNDVFGCGDIGHTNIMGCAPLNRSSANGCIMLPAPWDCDTSLTQEADFITKQGPEFGGALCCRD